MRGGRIFPQVYLYVGMLPDDTALLMPSEVYALVLLSMTPDKSQLPQRTITMDRRLPISYNVNR